MGAGGLTFDFGGKYAKKSTRRGVDEVEGESGYGGSGCARMTESWGNDGALGE